MVTLSLLKHLENNGFGVIDENLFWQKIGLNMVGVYISDIGQPAERGRMSRVDYELYSRGLNDVDGYQRLEAIVEFINNSGAVCKLPAVPPISTTTYKAILGKCSTIGAIGADETGRIVYTASGSIFFN